MTCTISINFADAEIPKRTGTQVTLAKAPDPPGSLQFFRNGVLMNAAFKDYTLEGKVVTPNPPLAKDDKVIASYRWTK